MRWHGKCLLPVALAARVKALIYSYRVGTFIEDC